MGRYSRLRFIRSLDPDHDCERISNLVTRYEFPLDYRLGFEYAVMVDNTVPSISELLVKTGQFRDHGQKRFDDTMLFEYEMKRAGLDSPHGHTAVRTLNKIHGRYDISNDDYLFILASQTLGPIDWINAYGWRRLTDHEIRALVNTNRRMAKLMGIKDVPETETDFRAILDTTLRERARYQDTNQQATQYVIDIITRWYPHPLRPLILPAVAALVDERLRPLLGLQDPPTWFTSACRGGLRARGRAVRLLPPRPTHRPYTPRPNFYGAGWTLHQLGPSSSHTEGGAS
ncbi:DUF2236 domain-containing protein [Streptomyces sp. NBC_00243]|uniref:oxygenase MpaB family protein n=1 Tax=Streptomyces sp. NBC_00243 TaxID=2975688 RepID=UPI002DDB8896|nr:oxygenase MpaB family protein [Streptomyces sp. NBC_00243]WRZ25253.1 DUF2236 domain-containing protein [Streptomyces sp. NBC_00243]